MGNRTYKDVFALNFTDEFGVFQFKTYTDWSDAKAKMDALSLYEIFFTDRAEQKGVFEDKDTNTVYRIYIFTQK